MYDLGVEQPPDEYVAHPGVGELLEPAGAGAVPGAGGKQGIPRISLVEISADHRGIGQSEVAVDQHRNPPERAQPLELVIAVEGRDRIDFIVEALQLQASQHLAHIGADEAADDLHDAPVFWKPFRVTCSRNFRNGWKAEIDGRSVGRDDAAMFPCDTKARADMKPGTLYALMGEGGWVYYGQVAPEKSVGFFHRRDRELAEVQSVLSSPMMAVVSVAYPSITRALRAGHWKKLGRYELVDALRAPRRVVQWPVGTLNVSVWDGAETTHETRVEDPAIQDLELMAVWDAQHHIPARLTADFGTEAHGWDVGGPIWRERRVKEETVKRFPDQPWNQLPHDWVPTRL